MKSVAQKICITLGFITLIALSVMPVYTYANDPTPNTQASAQPPSLPGLPSAGKAITSIVEFAGGTIGTLLLPVFYVVMTLAATLLGFSGLILDYILTISVVNLSKNLSGITSINTTWTVIRDLGNMSFIFILLYEGIRMVLGLKSTGVKKVVSGIIMAAVLVNFSLFFTKAIIDASNIVTLGFYRSIVAVGGNPIEIQGVQPTFGLSGAFMKVLRITELYKPANLLDIVANSKTPIIFIGNTLFMLIAAFVLLAVSVMFIIRYLSFIVLLIMSPFFFISMAVPGLDDLKNKYTKTLTSQALFAPVFMLMTWVTLTLAGDAGFLKTNIGNTLGDAVANPDGSTISLIVDYILIIGLLIQTLVLSKSVATKGGMVTKDMINFGQSYAGNAIFGGAARVGTQSIGRFGRYVADSDSLRERVEKGGVTGKLAQWTLQGAKKTADTSFDFRNASFVGDNLSKIGAGKGLKGGYDSYLKSKKDEDKAVLELIKPSDRAVAQAEETLKSDVFKEEEKKRLKDHLASSEYVKIVDEERAKRKKALDNATQDKQNSLDRLEKAEKNLTEITKSIEESEEYKALQLKLLSATTDESRKAIQAQIDEKSAPITAVQTTIKTLKNLVATKEKARSKAEVALNTGINDWIEAYESAWISEPQKKLIALKGGQEEKKYGKGDDLRGQIKTQEVTSRVDQYAKTIAERVGNRKSFWTPFTWTKAGGFTGIPTPEFNRERARNLKKGLKKKKTLEDSVKEFTKEEADKDDGGGSTPTPPPTPTPATTPTT